MYSNKVQHRKRKKNKIPLKTVDNIMCKGVYKMIFSLNAFGIVKQDNKLLLQKQIFFLYTYLLKTYFLYCFSFIPASIFSQLINFRKNKQLT